MSNPTRTPYIIFGRTLQTPPTTTEKTNEDQMTPRYPGARWYGIGGMGGRCSYRACSWHEVVNTVGVDKIAGWVGGSRACHGYTAEDGDCGQYADFHESVAGVLNGNGEVLTWENWDGLLPATNMSPDGSFGPNDIGWTPQQFERNADIMAWMVDHLGIPLHLMANTEEAGHGPHRLGVPQASGRVKLNYGPTKWTNHPGKQCPGDQRILQLPGMLARAQAILNGVRAGEWGWLPQGPVDVTNLRGGGSSAVPSVAKEKEWDEMASKEEIVEGVRGAIREEVRAQLLDLAPHLGREVLVQAISDEYPYGKAYQQAIAKAVDDYDDDPEKAVVLAEDVLNRIKEERVQLRRVSEKVGAELYDPKA